MWEKWKLGLVLIAIAGVASLVVTISGQSAQDGEVCIPTEELILLTDAQRQMEEYLSKARIAGIVEIREEGAFMLGAYPRSDVLWSIRIKEAEFPPETIALNAYCIRKGWVWIITGGVPSKITSFSQEQLAEMLHSQ